MVKIKTDKKQKLVGVEIERKRGRERYLGKALDIQRVRQKHNITLHPGWVRPHPHYPRYPVPRERDRERMRGVKMEDEPLCVKE